MAGMVRSTARLAKPCRAFSSSPDYTSYLSNRAKLRKPSAIRQLAPLLQIPGMISLGGGMPNPSTFPFESVAVTLKTGETLTIDGSTLQRALQYSPTPGEAALLSSLECLHLNEHQPPLPIKFCVTTGSQDGLSKAFDMLIEEGDNVLVEAPTYSGSLAALEPLGCNLIPVETDSDGLIPESLEATLNGWDESARGPRPRLLYTIPTGSNPSGGSMPLARKQQVYDIARAPSNNLLLLEDDPYYYLQFPSDTAAAAAAGAGGGAAAATAGGVGGARVPSLQSLDVDGRVLRFDSFSKVLSSGLRLGWVSGPAPLIASLELAQQSSTLHTSGISQAMAAAILQHWGAGADTPRRQGAAGGGTNVPGLEAHLSSVVGFYLGQRDSFLASAEKHLTGLATWSAPAAGMFVWFTLPGVEDTLQLIKQEAVEHKVLLVAGTSFSPQSGPSPCVRASYSTASPADMDTALSRLAALLRARAEPTSESQN